MLYVFMGFPKSGLHAGGLQYAVEEVEQLAILEHDPAVQYRKEGVFAVVGQHCELLRPVSYHLSQQCFREGITWSWFNEGWQFGNGVTIHKTMASPEYKTVVHNTDLTVEQFLAWRNRLKLTDLDLERIHIRHEGWNKYEARWLPGTCPQESHIVHLTWLVTTHLLPPFAYKRLQDLIEDPTSRPKHLWRYSKEPGQHFSGIRKWDGASAYHEGKN